MERSSEEKFDAVIGGTGVTIVVALAAFGFYSIAAFDLWGIEQMVNPEKQDKVLFLSLSLWALSVAVITGLSLLLKRIFTAIGVGWPFPLIAAWSIAVGIRYFDKSNYYQALDRNIWMSSPEKPMKMARGLTRDQSLIGKSRNEMIALLGLDVTDNTPRTWDYPIAGRDCDLVILFSNDTVTRIELDPRISI